ncbi:MAG: xanthine dehydrogenase family protein subunit M [Bacteroidetes bacterium]|nr:xanthine dehydrogenase family protein subunit M [Bacteroidota bacterium]
MMYISDFNYHRPKSLKEAIAILQNSDDGVPVAGGTDLLVEIKNGLRCHQDIVSLSEIDELKSVHEDEQHIYIGAGLTHNELIASAILRKKLSSLQDALSKIGSEQIRNKATLGGNLCTGSSCCDSAPVLMALNAKVEIYNTKGIKTICLKDFFVFNRQTILQKGEILTRIIIPKPQKGTGICYEKFGLREALAISVASVAVSVRLKKKRCEDACIVLGAVAPTPVISRSSIEIMVGKHVSEFYENSPLLVEIGKAAANDSVPVDDLRGSARYRKEIIKIITQRAVIKALAFTDREVIR